MRRVRIVKEIYICINNKKYLVMGEVGDRAFSMEVLVCVKF